MVKHHFQITANDITFPGYGVAVPKTSMEEFGFGEKMRKKLEVGQDYNNIDY